MAATYTLFHSPGACSRVAMTALEAAGVAYDLRLVQLAKGEQTREPFVSQNPKGKVPVLVTADGVLTELPAMALYLDARHPQAGLLAQGTDMERATSMAWMAWCASTLHPALYRIRMTPRIHPDAATHEAIRRAAVQELTTQLAVASKALRDGDWLMGRHWGLADAYLYWVIERVLASRADVVIDPALKPWRERCAAWPPWARAVRQDT